jgi:hypothetical protein
MSGAGLSRWGTVLGRTCPGWGPDIFGKCLWNLAWGLDMSGPRLSHWGIGLGRTCPRNASGIWLGDRICPVWDLVTEELGYVRHVQVGARTYAAKVTRTRLLSQIRLRGWTCLAWGSDMSGQSLWHSARMPDMSGLVGVFGGGIDFWCFALHQLTQCIPLDSMELLKLK